jgi:spore coat protein U-like protein
MKKIILATVGVALIGASLNASAAKVSANIAPSLTITAACSVNTAGVIPTFAPQVAGSTATGIVMTGGNLVVNCLQTYAVGANGGIHKTGGNQRNLQLGGVNIPYKLTIGGVDWGDAGLNAKDPSYTETMTDAAKVLAVPGTAADIYAISGLTTAALAGSELPGAYTDTVAITVAW